jgi:hypothetical protein
VSVARRRRVGIGDRVRVDGAPSVVISVTGTLIRLADEAGTVRTVTAAELACDPRFEIAAPVPARGPRPEIGLDGLPAAAVEEASWWEAHIAEVVYGLPPDAPAGARPRPQYDPERTSLTGREKAKAAELSAAGRPVPPSTVKHRRQRWEAHGLAGLVDHRIARRMRPAGRADDRRRRAGRWPGGRRACSGRCPRPRRARSCRSTPPRWTCSCCWTTVFPAGSS